MELYQQFGEELARRFDKPSAEIKGHGRIHTIKFDKPTIVNQLVIMEDYWLGERIRQYVVEVRDRDGNWRQVNRGYSVGRKRIIVFEPQEVTRISLRITKSAHVPLIRSMKAYYIDGMDCSYLIDKDALKPVSTGTAATTNDYHSDPYQSYGSDY